MKLSNVFAGLIALFAFAIAPSAHAQNVMVQTSITAAMTAVQATVSLTSVTSIKNGWVLDIDGEQMAVGSKWDGTSLTVPVSRYQGKVAGHASGAMVIAGRANWFGTYDPYGDCVSPYLVNVPALLSTPYINLKGGQTGTEWLCSSITSQWVPGWGNTTVPPQPTAAVASAAGLVTPSGPLFHITGALAITGFNIPVGFYTGSFTVIPDGAFTTTTANNIAIASTGVVSKALTFTYDLKTAKFYPSY